MQFRSHRTQVATCPFFAISAFPHIAFLKECFLWYTKGYKFLSQEVRENRSFFLLHRRTSFPSPSAPLSRANFKSLLRIIHH